MAGSSSDLAVTGPAAFAAVQEHNRPDTINNQAAEIKDLKRKVSQLNDRLYEARDMCRDLKRYTQDCNDNLRVELRKVAEERGYDQSGWPVGFTSLYNTYAEGPGSILEAFDEIAEDENEDENEDGEEEEEAE